MGKFFLILLYIYTAWHIFAFGGRTVEITYDDMGNRIQQVYDRHGNLTGIYDETGRKLKETSYSFEGEIINEAIYENGRAVKEMEYDPYLAPFIMDSYMGRTETKEYRYTPGGTSVEVILSVKEGHVIGEDSVTYNMQSADNYVIISSFTSYGSGESGELTVRINSIREYGSDYHIETDYNSDGTVEITDSRTDK